MLHSIWLPPQPSDVLQQALLPQTLLYTLISCCMAHISHTFVLKLSLCWWGVFKSYGSRHFELNTISCPNNVRPQNIDLVPEEMQGQVCAAWMWSSLGLPASVLVLLLLSTTDVGREGVWSQVPLLGSSRWWSCRLGLVSDLELRELLVVRTNGEEPPGAQRHWQKALLWAKRKAVLWFRQADGVAKRLHPKGKTGAAIACWDEICTAGPRLQSSKSCVIHTLYFRCLKDV